MRRQAVRYVVTGALVGLLVPTLASAAAQTLPVKSLSKAPALVHQIKIVNDRAPDTSSLKSIVESVTRDCRTNDQKAVAIYNVNRLFNYHRQYPDEPGRVSALKDFNVYGWSLCGGLHTEEAACWRAMGWKWRYIGWPGHTTVEAFYDGQWHYLDIFLKFYAWKPDAKAPGGFTIASQADIAKNPNLVLKDMARNEDLGAVFSRFDKPEKVGSGFNWTAQPLLVCGDGAAGVVKGCKAGHIAGSPTEWASIRFDDPNYSTDVNLSPGYSLKLTWQAIPSAYYWVAGGKPSKEPPSHTCGDKDYRSTPSIGPILEPYRAIDGQRRSYANGTLLFAPDLANDAFLAGLFAKSNVKVSGGALAPLKAGQPASITVELQSPYVMTRASGKAAGASAAVSLDGGKTFKKVELADFTAAVKGHYQALVKLTFEKPVKNLKLKAIVQCNRCALPYLAPGKNKITVSAADAKALGHNRLVVTYAYCTGYHTKSFESMVARGERIGIARNATWSEQPTVVQKVFLAKDLPATFEIDVPTPKGKFPAYPRHAFHRAAGHRRGPEAGPAAHKRPSPQDGSQRRADERTKPVADGRQPCDRQGSNGPEVTHRVPVNGQRTMNYGRRSMFIDIHTHVMQSPMTSCAWAPVPEFAYP